MPRLTKLDIANFRGIRKGIVSGFADVTLLVGRNNSGKSTVAEAMVTVAAAVKAQQPEPWAAPTTAESLGRWSTDRNEAGRIEERWFDKDRSKRLGLVAWIDGAAFSVALGAGSPGTVGIGTPIPPGAAFLSRWADFLPADAGNVEIEKHLWTMVLGPRKDKTLIAAVNEIFGMQVEQIQLPPDGRLLLVLAERTIALDAHGAGTRAAVRCLIKLALAERTLFVMEHPETHQHPGSLMRLGAAMCSQAKRLDTQLVITTHSIECIRAFLEGSSNAGSSFAVLHLGLANGKLDVRSIDAETLRGLDRTGMDVRDLDLYA
ncbi:MAG: AAA family ATPase [Deltaproteobacteria bacterium]|nr:AAA family ATPase [Deltaproteobacteria bacterium]